LESKADIRRPLDTSLSNRRALHDARSFRGCVARAAADVPRDWLALSLGHALPMTGLIAPMPTSAAARAMRVGTVC
jgi:hypothetical protein